MKEHPIIFSGEMVRAILGNRKSQTRRVIKPQADNPPYLHVFPSGEQGWMSNTPHKYGSTVAHFCPYGQPGDRLWVREAWADPIPGLPPRYRADAVRDDSGERNGWWIGEVFYKREPKWHPSIHMPRSVSRITLEITDVRVERLQDINSDRHDDVLKEGWPFEEEGKADENPVALFRRYWDSLNAKRDCGWDTNPWVWAISFKRIEGISQ